MSGETQPQPPGRFGCAEMLFFISFFVVGLMVRFTVNVLKIGGPKKR
jgi:hypothetical protein